jgi:hypothetical protein
MKKLLTPLFAMGLAISAAQPASAQITWNLNYTDGAGVGFNDATFGAGRKAVMTSISNQISGIPWP